MDERTGLPDHIEAESGLFEQVTRHDALAVALIDVDDMRGINDTHGHAFGDVVLRRLASLVQAAAGTRDLAARLRGDEFLLAWPGDDVIDAAHEADGLRARFRELRFPIGDGEPFHGLTLSAGVAGLEHVQRSRRQDLTTALVMAADEACLAAKRHGGDRVRIA
jgi:diguanylate cyclase (GGDEF)-like protein